MTLRAFFRIYICCFFFYKLKIRINNSCIHHSCIWVPKLVIHFLYFLFSINMINISISSIMKNYFDRSCLKRICSYIVYIWKEVLIILELKSNNNILNDLRWLWSNCILEPILLCKILECFKNLKNLKVI